MTDAGALEQALRDVAGDRVQAVRLGTDGSASAVIDVVYAPVIYPAQHTLPPGGTATGRTLR